MKHVKKWSSVFVFGGVLALAACGEGGAPADKSESTSGAGSETGAGETSQVVARVGREEITIHQINAEISILPNTAGQDPVAVQQAVLRGLIFRTALRQAASKEGLDRDPRLILLAEAAKDRVLSDAYVRSQTGSTPPPTITDVDQFIADNPLAFSDRRIYQFSRLTMPAESYSELLVPMFDEQDDYVEFEAYLNEKDIPYTIADVRLPSNEFPKIIQDQLVNFGIGDNVVVRGGDAIIVLKIKSWVDTPVEREDAEKFASQALHQQAMQSRASSLREQVLASSNIVFLGTFKDMKLVEDATPAAADEPPPVSDVPNMDVPVPGTGAEEGDAQ